MADPAAPASATDRSSFLNAVEAPISEDAPTGESVTYDDDFQTLKTEINKIGSAAGTTSYETIETLAQRILTEKSKDLRAAGYLVIGAARTRGAAGVAEALAAVHLLLDTFWEDLYPAKRRMRGRGSALQFVSDRLGDWLESTDFEPEDRDALADAHDTLKAIQDFGLQNMGEHAPALSGLNRVLERAINKLPEPEPAEPPEPASTGDEESTSPEAPAEATPNATPDATPDATTGASPTARRPSPSPSRPAASALGAIESDSDATTAVTEAASYMREADRTNPIPYRLLRAVRWDILPAEPPDDGGTTRLEAPLDRRRTYLLGLLDSGDYATLVEEGEKSFQSGTFHVWLDLQRILAGALRNLGTPYAPVHRAVLADTALLIDRLPGLPTLSFSDGTPFADPLTQDWLDETVRPLLDDDDRSAGRPAPSEGDLPATRHYGEAREVLSGGSLEDALAVMNTGAAEDATGKDTFHRRLYIATLCLKGGQPAVARPVLDRLGDAVDQHDLATWDPTLALEVWTHQCRCYDRLAQDAPPDEKAGLLDRADRAFDRICEIDAAAGVAVASRRPR